MPAPVYLSINEFDGDGVTTQHEFAFAGGYIDRTHVKAYITDEVGVITAVSVVDAMFVTDNTLDLGIAAPVGGITRIYRDTPRDEPLLDFTDNARITAANLDLLARQTILSVAEAFDAGAYAQVNDLLGAASAAALAAEQAQNAASDSADTAATQADLATTKAAEAAASAAALEATVHITPFSFGAIGDGVADDSAAIQAAVDSLAGGGVLFFPPGDYRVNTTVNVAASNIALVGAGSLGAKGSRIINGTTNSPAIRVGDALTQRFQAGVKGLSFAQASGVSPVAGNCGLEINRFGQCSIESLFVLPFPAALRNGIVLNQVSQSSLRDLQVQNCGVNGVTINRCNDLYISDVRSDSNGGTGVEIKDTNGVFATNVTAYSNGTYGWHLAVGAFSNNKNHFYTNCIGDTSGSFNWFLSECMESVFTACWGSTQQATGVNTFATGFYLSGTQVRDIMFVGCYAVFNNSHGVHLEQASDITFIGLIAGTTSHGNGQSGSGSGAFVSNNVTRARFYNSKFEWNASYGISVNATATDILVEGGVTRSNTTAAVGPTTVQSNCRVRNLIGYNPRMSLVTTPTFPASDATVTNNTGLDCDVYIVSGTLSAIFVNGAFILNATNSNVHVPAGATIKITYTVAPIWKWMAR